MENLFKSFSYKLKQIIISLTVVGVLLVVLSFLTVWTNFMAQLVVGTVVLLMAYAFLSTAFRLWRISQDIKKFLKIKK